MSDKEIPQEILILGASMPLDDRELEPRGGPSSRLPRLAAVDISNLQGQINVFLLQMNQIMSETPEKVEGFSLDEFEVSAGIVLEAKGGIQLILLANAEISGAVNASLKFVFRRSS